MDNGAHEAHEGHEEIWDTFFSQIHTPVKVEKKSNCKVCNTHYNDFIINSGDIICTNCGTVQEERIVSDEAEWNNIVVQERGWVWP